VSRFARRCLSFAIAALLLGVVCTALATADPPAKKQQSTPWPALSEDALREQLARVPELDLLVHEPPGFPDTGLARVLRQLEVSKQQTTSRLEGFPEYLQRMRSDLYGLPFPKGKAYVKEKEEAEALAAAADRIRDALERSVTPRPPAKDDPGRDKADFPQFWAVVTNPLAEKIPPAQMIAALQQLLPIERRDVRLEVVYYLRKEQDKAATLTLAQWAVFDLDEGIRTAATAALKGRPARDYLPILVDALRYPWAPIAQRSAEVLTSLWLKEAVPDLAAMLDEPDPTGVFMQEVLEVEIPVKRELVRVNHLRNCLLCHPASSGAKGEVVRAPVAIPDVELPRVRYDSSAQGGMVRAEVAYLRQDFSVMHKVDKAAPWPEAQRYDYLVRTRPLTSPERRAWLARQQQGVVLPPSPQRQALVWALRQLTRRDAGQ